MLSRGLEYYRQCWNAFKRAGMPLTVLEYLCKRLKCSLEDWNAFDSVDIHLYRVGMLSTGLERRR
jgi:hypothetical protein